MAAADCCSLWGNVIRTSLICIKILLTICVILVLSAAAGAQEREEQGKRIGKVSVVGNLILMELDEGTLGKENLFDLDKRTLRFTPAREGYRVENLPLQ